MSQKQACNHHQPGEQYEGRSRRRIASDLVIQREPELRAITPLICQLDARIRRDQRVDEVDARLRPVRVQE